MTHFLPPAQPKALNPLHPTNPALNIQERLETRREDHSPPVHGWMEEHKEQPPVTEEEKVPVSICLSSPWAS